MLPIALAATYLAINLGFVVRIARDEAAGLTPPSALVVANRIVRYGPPLLGLIYLETVAGDWLFLLFVIVFFAVSFWMLGRALNFPGDPPEGRRRP